MTELKVYCEKNLDNRNKLLLLTLYQNSRSWETRRTWEPWDPRSEAAGHVILGQKGDRVMAATWQVAAIDNDSDGLKRVCS